MAKRENTQYEKLVLKITSKLPDKFRPIFLHPAGKKLLLKNANEK